MIGRIVRLVLVAGWLALFASHVLRHALPGLGIDERRDLAATVAEHLDRVLRYDVSNGGKRIGWCEISFARDDNAFRLGSRLELTTLPFLSDAAQLHALARGSRQKGALAIAVSERLDEHCRLTGLEAQGRLFGISGRMQGTVDHRGFTGTIAVDEQPARQLTVPGMSGDAGQGFLTTLGLPPGLKPGDRFKSRMIGLDWLSLTPKEQVAVYTVEGEEPVDLPGGVRPALRVTMVLDGHVDATHWCDRRGTILRTRLEREGLQLDLVRETGADDDASEPATGARP